MIVLFTDFGLHGPYLGQVRAVLYQKAPKAKVIDLFADAPTYNVKASAHLLSAYSRDFPSGTVFLAVVDPGVGSNRRNPIIVQADEHWYVGPDNGLFNVVAAQAKTVDAWHISWQPERLSASFHGRDLFAPLAAELANGQLPADKFRIAVSVTKWTELLAEIVYIDHFGNLITGIRAGDLSAAASLSIDGVELPRTRVFSDVHPGEPLCYTNANGLLEISLNQGRADTYFNATIGKPVVIINHD